MTIQSFDVSICGRIVTTLEYFSTSCWRLTLRGQLVIQLLRRLMQSIIDLNSRKLSITEIYNRVKLVKES